MRKIEFGNKFKSRQLFSDVFFLSSYLLINDLFIFKYISRISVSPIVALVSYDFVMIFCFFLGVHIITKRPLPKTLYIVMYWLFSFSFVVICFILLKRIDPYSIKVDRWSAIALFLDNLFHGRYPYEIVTHLGNINASPLPILQLIAMPFYLLHDVGYLQVAIFIAFSCVLFIQIRNKAWAFFVLLFLMASPAYLYEISTRSELFSNFAIVYLFIILFVNAKKGFLLQSPWMIGAISGLLLSSRVLVAVPLILFSWFFNGKRIKNTAIYFLCMGIVFILTLLPFFLWDPHKFIAFSPFKTQADKTPIYVEVLLLFFTVVFASKISSLSSLFEKSTILIGAVMVATLLIRLFTLGKEAVFIHNLFDISYFDTVLPSVCLGFFYRKNEEEKPVVGTEVPLANFIMGE